MQTFTVSEINNYIKKLLAGAGVLQRVQIEGEVSNFKRYGSGHCYFSLKDRGSVLKCVMFKGRAMALNFAPQNGDKVVAIGRVEVYEQQGVYQLYTDILLLQGDGDLMRQFEELKNKLAAEGLFDEERKQKLPENPERIGIVTSASGAAVHDIITVTRRRKPGIKLYLFPVQVQGRGAAQEIARAIGFFNEHALADLLIVGRGGGSMEDLWAFNEETAVRAVAASKLPVISAVGHDIDFTLCDFAADKRAATPSQAAELAVPDYGEYRRRAQQSAQKLAQLLRERVRSAGRELERLRRSRKLRDPRSLYEAAEKDLARCLNDKYFRNPRLLYECEEEVLAKALNSWVFADPHRLFARQEQHLDEIFFQLAHSIQEKRRTEEERLRLEMTKLEAISPREVFKRGYSCARNFRQQLITSVEQVRWGDEITTTVQDGEIISVVQQVERR